MKSKVARKLIFYTILFSSIITLTITAIQLYIEFQRDVSGIHQKLEQIKVSYKESVTQATWLSDRKQLQLILDGITELPDIVYAEVATEYNEYIKSGSIQPGDKIKFKIDLDYLYNNKNIHIGKFLVIASLSGVYSRLLNRLWVILFSNALKTALVATFIYFLFMQLVTRHLSRISRFALKDEFSTLQKPLFLDRTIKTEDEFDVVVSSINELRRKLHYYIEELNQQKLYLSQTLHSIGDAVITTDVDGNVTQMNPVAEQLTGWSLAAAQGQPLGTIFPIIDASTHEPIETPVEKVITTGKTVYLSNHTTLISRDGKEYQIADSAAPIRDNDHIMGIVLVFNDVTEQYQLREAVAKSKRDMQAVMDNYPAVIYIKDISGCFIFINHQFEKLVHIKCKDIIGKTLHDIFPMKIADEMRRSDIDVLEKRQVLEIEEVASLDDGLHYYRSIKFPLFDEDDNIYAVCGISTDITDRKQQEEMLRRSQKMDALGKLSGGIAHDYNNLLGIIIGYSGQLGKQLEYDSRLAKYARDIQHAAERGAKLTKKLLAFSQHKISDSTVLDINTLLQGQQLMLERTLTSRIKLVLDISDNLWPVWLDSSDLEDAILNMSINALHAMEEGGELIIRTRNKQLNEMDAQLLHLKTGHYVLLSVIDNGSGMDEVTKEKIFEPFYTTKGEQGTGLGLSQVYGFVERSGGTIKVYSEPGHGSRFDLCFPRSHQPVTEVQTPIVKATLNLRGSETLLVVDDEQAMVELAHDILTSQGYRVLTANDGEQALAVLEEEAIDLVISDIIMPNMGGDQLANEVQQRYPHIKIQLVSGFADDRQNNMADDTLHQNMLHKPYESNTLLVRVRTILDNGGIKEHLAAHTILVMDDEEDVRELFKLNLERLGYKSIPACNGSEAIALYLQSLEDGEPIDAVILDLSVPGSMNGTAVAEKIRAMDPKARLIVASGHSESPEMKHYQNYGFQGALEKNFDPEKLKQVLGRVLSAVH